MINLFKNKFSYLFIFLLFFINFINISNALIISEIMYDPEGTDNKPNPEWIEVYNESASSTDLSLYKFGYDDKVFKLANADNASNTTIISKGDYGIILFVSSSTSFKSKHNVNSNLVLMKIENASSTGSLLTGASDFKTANELNLQKDDIKVFAAKFTASSGSTNKNTLNNIYNISTTRFCPSSGNVNEPLWYPALASPGATTTYSGALATSTDFNLTFDCVSNISSSGNSAPSPSEVAQNSYYNTGYSGHTYTIGDFRIIVPKDIYSLAGKETYIPAVTTNFKGEIIKSDILWSVGDGLSLSTTTARYVYKNPGDYIATAEAQQSGGWLYGIERVRVHIDKPDIIISDVRLEDKEFVNTDDDKKGYIEIYNMNDTEADIGGFYIQSKGGYFQLSKYLIIPAHSKFKLYNNIMNLNNLENTKLLFPNKTLLYEYKTESEYKLESQYTDIVVLKNSPNTNIINRPPLSVNIEGVLTENTNNTENKSSNTLLIKKENEINVLSESTTTNIVSHKTVQQLPNSKLSNTEPIVNNAKKEEGYPQPNPNPPLPFWKKLLYFLYD